jgi:predicted Zn-dependent protease
MSDKDIEKVILHEILHGFGLPHCRHKNCIMNDAKGKFSNLKNCNNLQGECKVFAKNIYSTK